ncbi:MAG TPA: hypothetical protein VI055_04975 [Rubrobacter sp.]|jgi:hypothetical protein
MAGSLEKRITDLERLYSASIGNLAEGPEGWREKMAATLRRGEEKAALEEVQGDSRRRPALNNLYKRIKREPDGA